MVTARKMDFTLVYTVFVSCDHACLFMSDDGEFALFNPPKYFSAHALKLSMHFDVTTTEYGVDEVAKALDLNPNRLVAGGVGRCNGLA